ncbi:hypothetical protein OOK29_09890 [Streptomyces phaeochromogenes]|uniref:hypothetical protein n=1 Tax=Streptomyces phaeochromogenes TaxID=1923 RepID=UPI0022531C82|nr:hypothetical protein [Streptomyces phaeochromogenes]MCX5598449.1 hypothetical protein [Streptomyces phaeochromogenes]
MPGKFNAADIDNAVSLYASGKTFAETSAETGISVATIHRAVKARGIEPPRPYRIPLSHLDRAVGLYVSGKSLAEVKDLCGVSPSALSRELQKRGIPARSRRTDLPMKEIADAYRSGESELSIAERFQVDRNVIRRVLTESGADMRDRSAAQYNRLAKMTSEERSLLTEAAHDAVRGRHVPAEELFARARMRESTLSHASPREGIFGKHLTGHTLEVTPQKAVGPYNVDFTVGPIAVEVLGGNWHAYKPEHAQRTPYLLNAGWHVLFVWDLKKAPLCIEAAEYVLAWAQQTSGNPAAVRQYRVIRGDGQLTASGCADDQHFPLVPASIANFSGRPID